MNFSQNIFMQPEQKPNIKSRKQIVQREIAPRQLNCEQSKPREYKDPQAHRSQMTQMARQPHKRMFTAAELSELLRGEAEQQLVYQRLLKEDILAALPENLKKSDKALKEALKEINEEEIHQLVKKRIASRVNKLLSVQFSAAEGEQYLYKVVVDSKRKNAAPKHILVTDPEEIQMFLDNPLMIDGEDYKYITARKPDSVVAERLMDRLIGKAPSVVSGGMTGKDGKTSPISVVVTSYGQDAQDPTLTAGDNGHIAARVVQNVTEDVVNQEENENTPATQI